MKVDGNYTVNKGKVDGSYTVVKRNEYKMV